MRADEACISHMNVVFAGLQPCDRRVDLVLTSFSTRRARPLAVPGMRAGARCFLMSWLQGLPVREGFGHGTAGSAGCMRHACCGTRWHALHFQSALFPATVLMPQEPIHHHGRPRQGLSACSRPGGPTAPQALRNATAALGQQAVSAEGPSARCCEVAGMRPWEPSHEGAIRDFSATVGMMHRHGLCCHCRRRAAWL